MPCLPRVLSGVQGKLPRRRRPSVQALHFAVDPAGGDRHFRAWNCDPSKLLEPPCRRGLRFGGRGGVRTAAPPGHASGGVAGAGRANQAFAAAASKPIKNAHLCTKVQGARRCSTFPRLLAKPANSPLHSQRCLRSTRAVRQRVSFSLNLKSTRWQRSKPRPARMDLPPRARAAETFD